MNNTYVKNILYHKLYLLPNQVNKDIEQTILKKMKSNVGDKCIKEGFVDGNSIEIIKRSLGQVDAIHFNGRICYDICYSAKVCNPMEGTKLEGKILDINKMGALVKIGPLSIVLPKQYHNNPSIFSKINKDSTVVINIVGTKFELYDTEIEAVGLIESVK
jgi:DNA-directed RNA polymerase subunit E'/Rpb7